MRNRNGRSVQQSTSWLRANLQLGASATTLILAMAAAQTAQAQCAPPVGAPPTVTCDDPTLNPHPGGISVTTATGMMLNIGGGVQVVRTGDDNSGVRLVGTGADVLRIQLAQGASVETTGLHADGLKITAAGAGHSDIEFDVSGDVRVTSDAPDYTGVTTSGVSALVSNAAGTGNISFTQGSTSTVTMQGLEMTGLYALNLGLGSISITTDGVISGAGDAAYGVMGQIANNSSTGAVVLRQGEGASMLLEGWGTEGLYALNQGRGDAGIVVEGLIETRGPDSGGAIAHTGYAASTGTASVHLTEKGRVVVNGDGSHALRTYNTGLGASLIESEGEIEVSGADSAGLQMQAINVNNAADLTAVLSGQASVKVSGDNSHGVWLVHSGTGQAVVDLRDASAITTSGDGSHGVFADASADGEASITQGAGSTVSTTGAGSIGLAATARNDAAVSVAGAVTSSGEYGAGVQASSLDGAAGVTIASGASVMGGWQAAAADVGALSMPSAGVLLSSGTTGLLSNAGTIGAFSDRAVADASRWTGLGGGPLSIANSGLITGFVEYGAGAGNSFINAASGQFDLRHFADTDGDGVRDTKRVAVSDFGGAGSVFDNAGLLRLAAVNGATNADVAGYYVPTTGVDNRALDSADYSLSRAGVVQGQLINLGQFNHSGVIDLRGAATGNTLVMTSNASAGGAAGSSVFVSNGGQLYLNAVLNGGMAAGGASNSLADMLILDSTRLGSGATLITVGIDPASVGAQTTGNGIQLIEVRNKAESADGVFALAHRLAGGVFDYTLRHNGVGADAADGNWYLRTSIADPNTPGVEYPNYRPEIPTLTAVPAQAARFGLDMLGTYHDRVGEDYADRTTGGDDRRTAVWGRGFGGSGDVGEAGDAVADQYGAFRDHGPSYAYDSGGVQVGVDLLRRTADDGSRNMAGFYLGYGELRSRVNAVYGGRSGRTTLEGTSLGFYWTHKDKKNRYLDAVLQASRYDVTGVFDQGGGFGADGSGYSASLEVGAPFRLDDHWRLEPQGQLIYQHVAFDQTQDAFGLVDYEDADALYGRLGARLARDWVSPSGMNRMAWARFNVWHDFDNQATTQISSLAGNDPVALQTDLGGTWGQLQLAMSSQLDQRFSVFASGDYNFAFEDGRGDGYGWRIGLRMVW